MSKVPRQNVSVNRTQYGWGVASDSYVESGHVKTLLLSESHHRLRGGGWSGGGPFYQVTESLDHGSPYVFPGYVVPFWGDKVPPQTAIGVVPAPIRLPIQPPQTYYNLWHNNDMYNKSFTAAGYRKTRPGNPIASVGQFLLELRDLPRLPFQGNNGYVSVFRQGLSFPNIFHYLRSYASDFRNIGSEYLNVVFGWKPFISDLRKAYGLWKTIDRRMADIIRNNGKGVRRRANVSSTTNTYPLEENHFNWAGVNVYGFPSDLARVTGSSHWRKFETYTEKVWYSAKYRYYIPDVTSSQWDARARLALFGALPTPELIWEVVPFSWLIDWAVNVQDVVSNMSENAVDNLVQEYSFIMRSTKSEVTWSCDCTWQPWWSLLPGGSHSFKSVKTYEVKTRSYGGSPYALNAVTGEPLTVYQSSVLAALGLNLAR